MAFGLTSLACAFSTSMFPLIALRFFQGATGSAAAVFAPGFIRESFEGPTAVRAHGAMGSIESLVPAFAPVVGAWLLARFDHRASFIATGCASLVLGALAIPLRGAVPGRASARATGSYARLLRDPVFMRYALSQAMTLGGLLTFVFGPGFFRAVVAAGDDDARGAALVVLAVMLTAAVGTACVAPMITRGLFPLALGASVLLGTGVFVLRMLPSLDERSTADK